MIDFSTEGGGGLDTQDPLIYSLGLSIRLTRQIMSLNNILIPVYEYACTVDFTKYALYSNSTHPNIH